MDLGRLEGEERREWGSLPVSRPIELQRGCRDGGMRGGWSGGGRRGGGLGTIGSTVVGDVSDGYEYKCRIIQGGGK